MKVANVEDEYKKFPELAERREDVFKIMEWTKQEPHLPNLDEREVMLFFYAHHYHTEVTKQVIDLHFTTKTDCPEFFTNTDPLREEMQIVMKVITAAPVEKRTPAGQKIVIGKFADSDASKFNFVDCAKLFLSCYEMVLAEDGIASGHVIVVDMTGVTLGHVARIGLLAMKKCIFLLQEATPMRIGGFHFINSVPFVDKILAMMKPFMKEELRNILHAHTSLETFYKFVPKEILPAEYGGTEESLDVQSGVFALRGFLNSVEMVLAEGGIASGHVIVVDMTGVTLGHVARVGLLTMKKYLFLMQEATPMRMSGFHYVNSVPFVDKLLAIMKPFMKEELRNILHVHTSLETLYKFVPKEILPVDYGGPEESLSVQSEKFYKKVLDNREFFLNQEATRRVNEKLRPGKSKTASDLFGTEGNFRQLVID